MLQRKAHAVLVGVCRARLWCLRWAMPLMGKRTRNAWLCMAGAHMAWVHVRCQHSIALQKQSDSTAGTEASDKDHPTTTLNHTLSLRTLVPVRSWEPNTVVHIPSCCCTHRLGCAYSATEHKIQSRAPRADARAFSKRRAPPNNTHHLFTRRMRHGHVRTTAPSRAPWGSRRTTTKAQLGACGMTSASRRGSQSCWQALSAEDHLPPQQKQPADQVIAPSLDSPAPGAQPLQTLLRRPA